MLAVIAVKVIGGSGIVAAAVVSRITELKVLVPMLLSAATLKL